MLAVPDLFSLSKLMLDSSLTPKSRFETMQMMFGGQLNDFDYHFTGFYFEYLEELLLKFGFCEVRRVEKFGIFLDSSDLMHMVR